MGLYRVVGQIQSCDLGCTYGQLVEVDAYRRSGDQDRAVDTLQQSGQLMGIEGFAGVQHHGAGLQMLDSQAQFAALVDNAAKNAPAGSETAVAMMKSAVAAANNAFESVQKAVKQASDVAEANFNAVTTSATTAAKNAGAAAKKAAR